MHFSDILIFHPDKFSDFFTLQNANRLRILNNSAFFKSPVPKPLLTSLNINHLEPHVNNQWYYYEKKRVPNTEKIGSKYRKNRVQI